METRKSFAQILREKCSDGAHTSGFEKHDLSRSPAHDFQKEVLFFEIDAQTPKANHQKSVSAYQTFQQHSVTQNSSAATDQSETTQEANIGHENSTNVGEETTSQDGFTPAETDLRLDYSSLSLPASLAWRSLERLSGTQWGSSISASGLKRRYRQLARKYHPDCHPEADEIRKKRLNDSFQLAVESYQILEKELIEQSSDQAA